MRPRGSRLVATYAGAVALACVLRSSDAGAGAVAYPRGSFARFSAERALVVWDAAHETEHLVRTLSLRGDPGSFGVVIPTPSTPAIAKEDDAVLDRVAQLAAQTARERPSEAASSSEAKTPTRAQIGDFQAATLASGGGQDALDAWLGKNAFVDEPALRQWAKSYFAKGWPVTALRCTAKGTGDRTLEVPTVRLSFKIDAPFFPYEEVPPSLGDESAFRARYDPRGASDAPYAYGSRSFDLYLVAPSPMQAMLGARTGGPRVIDSVRVTSAAVAAALGDTRPWGFDPTSRPTWVVTHLTDDAWQRSAAGDLTLSAYDLPNPRSAPGVSEPENAHPGAAAASFRAASKGKAARRAKATRNRARRLALGAVLLIFLVGGAVAFAVISEQDKTRV